MQDKGPHIEEVDLDPRQPASIQKKVIEAEVENANRGRNTGLLIILVGVILTLVGVSGAVDLHLSGLGLNAKVGNAAPGVVLMLIGLFVIWRSNLRINAAKTK